MDRTGTVRFELTTFFRSARFQDECHKPDSTKYPFFFCFSLNIYADNDIINRKLLLIISNIGIKRNWTSTKSINSTPHYHSAMTPLEYIL